MNSVNWRRLVRRPQAPPKCRLRFGTNSTGCCKSNISGVGVYVGSRWPAEIHSGDSCSIYAGWFADRSARTAQSSVRSQAAQLGGKCDASGAAVRSAAHSGAISALLRSMERPDRSLRSRGHAVNFVVCSIRLLRISRNSPHFRKICPRSPGRDRGLEPWACRGPELCPTGPLSRRAPRQRVQAHSDCGDGLYGRCGIECAADGNRHQQFQAVRVSLLRSIRRPSCSRSPIRIRRRKWIPGG